MTFLPIVERELRIAARLTATYRNRAIAAGVVMFVAIVMLTFGGFARSYSRAGASMFRTLSFLTILFCVTEGIRKTADCLSEEKREGTLGLLFLTDLKGYDVVLGKLVATSMNSIYGLFGILPVLALPMLVGGVTAGEFWRIVLALANLLFFSLCAGMLVSAWCRQESRAMSGTLALILAFLLLPGLLPVPAISTFSPARAYTNAFAATYYSGAHDYWQSLVITQALSWLMLAVASVTLPRLWQDQPVQASNRFSRSKSISYVFRDSPRRGQSRREMLDTNPALWLAMRDSRLRIFLWGLCAVVAVTACICLVSSGMGSLPVFIGVAWLANFILKMRVAAQACHCLAEARRNNALEMLLATPLSTNEIISGQTLALKRIFTAPIIAIISIEALTLFAAFTAESNGRGGLGADGIAMIVGGLYLAMFFLDIVAVTWAGMWFGLSAKNETQAITKTILLVLIMPFASSFLCWFGVIFYIGIPIFWIGWCSSKLKAEFRNLAAQRYLPAHTGSGWFPATPKPDRPPIFPG